MRLEISNPIWLLGLLCIPPLVWVAWKSGSVLALRRRVLSATVRTVLLCLLILALAGLQTVAAADRLGVVFLIDVSDSTGADARPAARALLANALHAKPAADQAAVVLFGATPLVERFTSAEATPPDLSSVPDTTQTDIAAAVRLGLALFPEDSARRMVLVSDGNETTGSLERAAQLARASGARLDIAASPPKAGDDVILESVTAPAAARFGETVPIRLSILSTIAGDALLRLYQDGSLVGERTVQLGVGSNVYPWLVDVTTPGFVSFTAQVTAANDGDPRNNDGGAFTVVRGQARVLLVEGTPGNSVALQNAMTSGSIDFSVVAPDRLPDNPLQLSGYDAVVLVNVPSVQLAGRMEPLVSYVRDLGRGLVAIGGDQSFKPGGWTSTPLETALPVTMDPKNRLKTPNVGLVIVIDKSGSMGACPDARGNCTGANAGLTRLELARRTAFWTLSTLSAEDQAGVLAFDDKPLWLQKLGAATDPTRLQSALGTIDADGGTNFGPALREAVATLAASNTPRKHILLLSDGLAGDSGFDDVLAQARAAGITLSTVLVGSETPELLNDLARRGGGETYFATSAESVPNIVAKETRLVERTAINEETFRPVLSNGSPFLRDQGPPPILKGFLGTTAKPQAELHLTTPEGDPILAAWQFGLGRSVAWTSDADGRWSADWLAWEGFARFWSEVVRSVLPPAEDATLRAAVRTEGSDVIIEADAVDESGAFRNGLATIATVRAPSGTAMPLQLPQTAPGHYEARFHPDEHGAYVVSVLQAQNGQAVAGQVTGFVQSYSPEYRVAGQDLSLLKRAADATGGGLLANPEAAFAHDIYSGGVRSPLWPPLMLLAALLWPIDIAMRRLLLARSDFTGLRRRIWRPRAARARALPARGQTETSPLFAAKQRANYRLIDEIPLETAAIPLTPTRTAEPVGVAPAGESLSRLRAAKHRAIRPNGVEASGVTEE